MQFFTIKEINRVLKQLNLKPKESIKDALLQKRRFCSTVCQTKKNSKVFIKILLAKSKEWQNSLTTEATIVKLLTFDPKFKNQIIAPNYLDSNFSQPPYWLMRQYIKGRPIGRVYTLFKPSKKIRYIKKAIDNIIGLQHNSQDIITKIKEQNISLKNIGLANYWIRFQKYQQVPAIKQLSINWSQVQKLYQQIQSENQNLLVLIHGDFSLSNQVLSDQSKVYTIDWEWIRMDNPAIDIAYIWLLLWRYPKIQAKIKEEYLKRIRNKKNFLDLFSFISFHQSLSEIYGGVVPAKNWTAYIKFIKKNFSPFLK